MKTEIRKVDSQGRIVLSYKWREKELKDNNEVIILEEKGVLKIIPKKKIDLTKFFDTIELDEDLLEKLENWSEFENYLFKKQYHDRS
ncbi:MAG: AbrB/MazE/SpoVT family DNA-binding domain-containing protein [Candidatus Lokiarchaeota archaeon]|nr:AbrB/MazE/SpoVT family DNA-binding domain-containing protein [Candidatus Lokiarchaeota archaeon]MBD3199913.1 AbrB/MazE/SpoVT family DNA-binding domain-containing protein [Candidatus Lokiarchaeota archaeon]